MYLTFIQNGRKVKKTCRSGVFSSLTYSLVRHKRSLRFLTDINGFSWGNISLYILICSFVCAFPAVSSESISINNANAVFDNALFLLVFLHCKWLWLFRYLRIIGTNKIIHYSIFFPYEIASFKAFFLCPGELWHFCRPGFTFGRSRTEADGIFLDGLRMLSRRKDFVNNDSLFGCFSWSKSLIMHVELRIKKFHLF